MMDLSAASRRIQFLLAAPSQPLQSMTINPNGRVLWEGVSPYDGTPIVCIVTGLSQGSANGKTGTMLQTWILPRDIKPHHGFKDGRGASVCGDCPHAGYNQGSCYVKWFQAPLSVWNAYHRGSYAPIGQDWHIFTGRAVRFGAAGDPAMVPAEIWQRILEFCDSHTGYTHQWRQPWAQGLRGICQASCDGFADYMAASDAGWRCFLVAPKGATAPKGMAHCAASIERGQKTTCQACTLCDGASADVFINAHGASAGKVTA